MASSSSCRLIPWEQDHPAFHVTENDEYIKLVAKQFTKPKVYYLGSSSQCGCGFRHFDAFSEKPEEMADTDLVHTQLHKYLVECLKSQDCVELYGCWSGDESEPVEHLREVKSDKLSDPEFFFRERELTRVSF